MDPAAIRIRVVGEAISLHLVGNCFYFHPLRNLNSPLFFDGQAMASSNLELHALSRE